MLRHNKIINSSIIINIIINGRNGTKDSLSTETSTAYTTTEDSTIEDGDWRDSGLIDPGFGRPLFPDTEPNVEIKTYQEPSRGLMKIDKHVRPSTTEQATDEA